MVRQLTHRILITCAATAALATGARAQEPVPHLLDWKAAGGTGAIQSGAPFTLKNVTEKEGVRFGTRTWGINLVWDARESPDNIKFEKQFHSGAVNYAEPIAIYVTGGGYLKYEKTRFGINLVYSRVPSFEWRAGGGDEGKPIKFGDEFALLNDVEHDAMIYGKRPVGINLVWMKDFYKSIWDRIKPTVLTVLKETGKASPYLTLFLGL
jgi:hypothetical protein